MLFTEHALIRCYTSPQFNGEQCQRPLHQFSMHSPPIFEATKLRTGLDVPSRDSWNNKILKLFSKKNFQDGFKDSLKSALQEWTCRGSQLNLSNDLLMAVGQILLRRHNPFREETRSMYVKKYREVHLLLAKEPKNSHPITSSPWSLCRRLPAAGWLTT